MVRPLGRSAIVLGLVVLLFAAGCSNDDDKDTSAGGGSTSQGGGSKAQGQFADLKKVDEPSPCTNDPGVSDTEIKVGVIAPETGARAASFGPSVGGMKAYIEKANSEKILGDRKITLTVVDDRSDAAANGEAARQLIEQDKVFGIIENSDQASGSGTYLHDKGIPVTGWHVGVKDWSTYPNMFTFRQGISANPEKEYTDRNAKLVKALGGTKAALVGGGNQSSVAFVDKYEKVLEGTGVADVVYKTTDVVSGSTDFAAVVQRIKESGADTVATGMDLLQNAALVEQLRRAGVEPKVILFPGGYDPRVTGIPGMDGAIFGVEFRPFELKSADFQQFDKWAPKDVVRGQVPYIGWLSAELFVEGVKQAGLECPTRKAFIANLRLLKGYDANGAFDPVDFVKDFGKEFKCIWYVKVVNKQFVPQFDGKSFCGEDYKLS